MPDRSDDYQIPSWPPTRLDREFLNPIFKDLAVRLTAREDLEASFEALQAQGIQASLDYIQVNVAPQIANLQTSIQLAQDQINQIIIDGVSPNSLKLGGQLPAYYATAQALQDGLSGKVSTSLTINGKPLNGNIALGKNDVGLGEVDNTKDADKPISTPQAAALAKRVRVDADAGFTAAEKARALANIGGGALAGLRNKFINPLFAINNRAVAGTVNLAPFAYGHDRLKAGGAGCTYTFSAANGVTTINITSGSLLHVIEASAFSGEPGNYVLGWVGTAQGRIDGGAWGNSGAVSKVCDGSANVTIEFGVGTVSLVQFEKEYLGAFSARHRSTEENLCLRYFRPFADVRFKTNTLITGGVLYYAMLHHYGMRAAPSYIFAPNPAVFTQAAGIDSIPSANLSISGAGDRHSSRIGANYTGTGQTSGFHSSVALEAEL